MVKEKGWGLVLLLVSATCGGASVAAHFEPEEIVFGATAQLVVTVHAQSRGTVAPEIAADGIALRRIGAVHRVGSDGGVVSTFTYLATPSRTGILTLDPVTITVEGDPLPLPAASLSVRRLFRTSPTVDSPPSVDQIRLTVLHAPQRVYVGEVVPVELALMVPNGSHFRVPKGYPQKIGDQFAQGNPTDPLIGAMVREKAGPSPEQLRWRTLVTARQAKILTLAFAIGLSMEVPSPDLVSSEVGQRWKDLFKATPEWVPITVFSEQYTVEAIPLPEEKQPAGFSGAIGQFALLSPEIRWVDGSGNDDSVEFTFPVQGTGNLPTIAPPNLPIDGNWRLAKVRKDIHSEDKLGYRTTVSFRYTLIPLSNAAIPPSFQLSYFDPTTNRYEILQHRFSQPIGARR